MENQEHDLSLEVASTHDLTHSQTQNNTQAMPQQNQFPQYGNMPSFYGNTPMNMSSSNMMQPGQTPMNQPNFNSYGFSMPNMMQNQGGNGMMPQGNYDWFQNNMRGFNQQQQQQQVPMNQGFSPMDFFALANNMIMNNNMYRNPMGNPMMNLGQPMNQPNMNQFMNQSLGQSFSVPSKTMDSSNKTIEDALANNMNSMNQFYNYINNQNKDAGGGMNLSNMSNQNASLGNTRKTQESLADSVYLNTKTEFVNPLGSSNGFVSKNSTMQLTGISQFDNDPYENGQKQHFSNSATKKNLEDMRRGVKTETYEDDGAQSIYKSRDFIGGNEEKTQRNQLDWEDRPIKSNYNANKNSNNNRQAFEDEYENEEYDKGSRTNVDYNSRQEYKNPHDDIPIGGKGNKRFEDLLQEQLKANPDAFDSNTRGRQQKSTNRTFLKKGARTFLSSANTKQSKSTDQKENISSPRNEKPNYQNDGSRTTKDKSSLKANNNFANQQEKSKPQNKFESTTMTASTANVQETSHANSDKPKQRFLQRGGGTGGGIGGAGSTIPSNRQKKSPRGDEEQEREEERSKSVTKSRGNSKKNILNDAHERSLKNDKSQEKLRNSLYPDNAHHDDRSFEREYNADRNLKKSPKGKKAEPKPRKSPKYQFEEEGDEDENHVDGGVEDGGEFREEAPQVSNLVNKFFYKKKAIKTKEVEDEEGEANTEDEKVQKVINEKIEILNSEIAKFKLENERVKKIRQKHEEMLKNLNRDIAEWNKQKDKESKEFEDWKQEEMRKMKNEKKLAERQQKTLSNMPNRKERDEIDNLKKQIAKLNEDLQLKDKRSKLNIERLKRQIEELEERNSELEEDLKAYGHSKPKTAGMNGESQGKKNAQKYNEPEEEEQEEEDDENYGEDKQVIEERNEDEEDEEGYREGEEENEGGNESDNDNLTYDDIVNKNKGDTNQYHHPSPKFVGEKKLDNKQGNLGGQQQSRTNQNPPARNSETLSKLKNETAKMGRNSEASERSSIQTNVRNIAENEYRFDSNKHFKSYIGTKNESNPIVNQTVSPDGKIQRIYANGKKEVVFHNGVKREIMPDGYTIVHFTNNDVKQTLPDSTIIYFFADAQTTQTTLPNGLHIYRFANNQLEFHNADGSKDIYFADGTRKVIHLNGEEETLFTDGTVQRVNAQKIKTIDYANGQRDVIYLDGLKIRTYPDGRMKKYYPNGSIEEIGN